MSELHEAFETNDAGAIFFAKPSSSSSSQPSNLSNGNGPPASGMALASDPESSGDYDDNNQDFDDVVSLELLTVVEDGPEKSRMEQFCSKRMILCWLLGLTLLILAVALPLSLKDSRDDVDVSTGSEGGVDSIFGEATPTAYQVLRPIVSDPDALLNPTTPQGQAYLAVETEQDPFHIQQQYALQTMYYATDGEAWVFNHGWETYSRATRSSDNLCEWAGVTICRNRGDGKMAVAGLDLDSNNMQGSLPEDLCLLDGLERLRVANNQLDGTVPSCLGSLPTLIDLEVEGNPDLDENAVSDPLFCENDRSWEVFVVDCSVACDCCTSCV